MSRRNRFRSLTLNLEMLETRALLNGTSICPEALVIPDCLTAEIEICSAALPETTAVDVESATCPVVVEYPVCEEPQTDPAAECDPGAPPAEECTWETDYPTDCGDYYYEQELAGGDPSDPTGYEDASSPLQTETPVDLGAGGDSYYETEAPLDFGGTGGDSYYEDTSDFAQLEMPLGSGSDGGDSYYEDADSETTSKDESFNTIESAQDVKVDFGDDKASAEGTDRVDDGADRQHKRDTRANRLERETATTAEFQQEREGARRDMQSETGEEGTVSTDPHAQLSSNALERLPGLPVARDQDQTEAPGGNREEAVESVPVENFQHSKNYLAEAGPTNPQSSSLMDGAPTSNLTGLELGMQQMLDRIESIGMNLAAAPEGMRASLWLAAGVAAMTAYEVVRWRKEKSRYALAAAAANDNSTTSWLSSLSGPMTEED